jgi:AraC-like DNA-binding protein
MMTPTREHQPFVHVVDLLVYALREGDLFIADPGVYHEIRSLKTTDLKLYFLAFNIAQARGAVASDEYSGLSQQTLANFVRGHSVHLGGQSHLTSLFKHAMQLSRRDGEGSGGRFHRAATFLLLTEITAALTDEITQRRIERAGHLLLLPDISVAEAGYQVGIESPARFSRIFKRVKRLTPTEYRRKYLGRVPSTLSVTAPFRTEFLDGDREEYRI